MKKKYVLLNLFPFFAKKVAIGIIALLILFFILIMAIPELYFLKEYEGIYKIVFFSSLLTIVLSKMRVEDEMIMQNRLRAFAASFIFGVVCLIVEEFFNFIPFLGTEKVMSASDIILQMFMFYFIMFFILNYSSKKS